MANFQCFQKSNKRVLNEKFYLTYENRDVYLYVFISFSDEIKKRRAITYDRNV